MQGQERRVGVFWCAHAAGFRMAKQPVAWPNEIQEEEEEGIPGGMLRRNLPGLLQIKESSYFVTTL